MKKFLLMLVFGLCCVSVFCQEGAPFRFVKVIQSVNNDTKENLYVRLKSFMVSYYRNSKYVIQMEDKDACVIIGKATTGFNTKKLMLSSYNGWLDYTINLQARDGRVRVELSQFTHINNRGNNPKSVLGVLTTDDEYPQKRASRNYDNKVWKMLKQKAEETAENIFVAVEEAINSDETYDFNDDDW